MNAVSDVATINKYARAIEDTEARQRGVSVADVRPRIADRIGISPGTMENFRRLRTKVVPNWLMNRMRAELINVLQSEIRRLEHEIHIARQTGADHSGDALASATAQVIAAKEILRAAR